MQRRRIVGLAVLVLGLLIGLGVWRYDRRVSPLPPEPEPPPAPPPASELLVANPGGDSVLGFERDADGRLVLPPWRRVQGPDTGLRQPVAVAVTGNVDVFVANGGGGAGPPSVSAYPGHANGNARPVRTIEGGEAGLLHPAGIHVKGAPGILVTNAADPGGTSAVLEFSFDPAFPGPTGRIEGPATTLGAPLGTARDNHDRVYVTEPARNEVLGFLYHPGTIHDTAPQVVLSGPATDLGIPVAVGFDQDGRMYVLNRADPGRITVYADGAQGNAAPIRTIVGPRTTLQQPSSMTVDDPGRIYVSQGNSLIVFEPGADGDAQPMQVVGPSDAPLSGPLGMVVR